VPPLVAKAAEEGGKQPESGGKSRKTADLALEKDQKDGIQGPQRIVQWSRVTIARHRGRAGFGHQHRRVSEMRPKRASS